jgi:hypothetical protein
MLDGRSIELVVEAAAGLGVNKVLLAEVRHLLRGVLFVETDDVGERPDAGIRAAGEIRSEASLDLVLEHDELGGLRIVAEGGPQIGMAGDIDVVEQLGARIAQNLQGPFEDLVRVLAVPRDHLAQDADARAAETVRVQRL